MARLPRFCPAGLPQHIIQRGNNRSTFFSCEQDFTAYANWLKKYANKCNVAVHAWVFMTNHAHLLVTPSTDDETSLMMLSLGRRYVRYFNHRYKRSGTLWEGRFRSSVVQTEYYLLACYRYIELNPVRAGMVNNPAEYIWSSYRHNALDVTSALCTHHDVYLALGMTKRTRLLTYQTLFDPLIDSGLVSEISKSLNKGLALGSKTFVDEIEVLYGRRVTSAVMGRPKKPIVVPDPTYPDIQKN